MQPRISLITLGVEDLERALRFYRDGLGWTTAGIVGREFEHGAVAFFDLEGIRLALWQRADLAHEAGLPLQPPRATGFMLAHNVAAPEQVAAVLQQAESAGARIVRPAGPAFWGGVAGLFQDPDGHLWEVAWNPQLPPPR